MTRSSTDIIASSRVLLLISEERERQEVLWGEQNWNNGSREWRQLYRRVASEFKENNPARVEMGTITWADILGEEVAEALSEEDEVKLREELIQVAAVCVNWIDCIDRRDTDG